MLCLAGGVGRKLLSLGEGVGLALRLPSLNNRRNYVQMYIIFVENALNVLKMVVIFVVFLRLPHFVIRYCTGCQSCFVILA